MLQLISIVTAKPTSYHVTSQTSSRRKGDRSLMETCPSYTSEPNRNCKNLRHTTLVPAETSATKSDTNTGLVISLSKLHSREEARRVPLMNLQFSITQDDISASVASEIKLDEPDKDSINLKLYEFFLKFIDGKETFTTELPDNLSSADALQNLDLTLLYNIARLSLYIKGPEKIVPTNASSPNWGLPLGQPLKSKVKCRRSSVHIKHLPKTISSMLDRRLVQT